MSAQAKEISKGRNFEEDIWVGQERENRGTQAQWASVMEG